MCKIKTATNFQFAHQASLSETRLRRGFARVSAVWNVFQYFKSSNLENVVETMVNFISY
jgi:hypothetical protein